MSLLSFLKKSDKSKSTINLGSIEVDFHSHLIPKVDDGCQSIEDTSEILDFFISKGYRKIYTSPHIMGEGYTNTKEDLIQRFDILKSNPLIFNKNIELGLIAEYYMDENFELLVKSNDLLTFDGNKVLMETSMNYEFPNFKTLIFELINQNYNPILAHPERYTFLHETKGSIDKYEELKDMGVLFQLNMFSLIGLYGRTVQHIAESLIDHQLIDYVSSDIHRPQQIELFDTLEKNVYLSKLIDSNLLKNKNIK